MATEFNPNYCLHPGEFLKDDLSFLKMSQKEFAAKTGISKTIINGVIKGKRKVNALMALKFEEVIGEPAAFWLGAQREYDLFMAKNNSEKPSKGNKKDKYNFKSIGSSDLWSGGSYAASVFVG